MPTSVEWRKEREHEHLDSPQLRTYARDSYLINASVPRFGSGEAKGVIKDSVRGADLYLLVDVCNYSLTYSVGNIRTTCLRTIISGSEAHHRSRRRKSAPDQRHHAVPLREPPA